MNEINRKTLTQFIEVELVLSIIQEREFDTEKIVDYVHKMMIEALDRQNDYLNKVRRVKPEDVTMVTYGDPSEAFRKVKIT